VILRVMRTKKIAERAELDKEYYFTKNFMGCVV
jgi:hypothetical protein